MPIDLGYAKQFRFDEERTLGRELLYLSIAQKLVGWLGAALMLGALANLLKKGLMARQVSALTPTRPRATPPLCLPPRAPSSIPS